MGFLAGKRVLIVGVDMRRVKEGANTEKLL